MIQVTITEKNDWEGETFSYIMEVNAETLSLIKKGLANCSAIKVQENTIFTPDEVDKLNAASRNTYMPRFAFYELEPLPEKEFNWYDDVFYKGKGLKLIKYA